MTPLEFYKAIRPTLTEPQAQVIDQHLQFQTLDYVVYEAEIMPNVDTGDDPHPDISIRVDFSGGGYSSEQFFVDETGRVYGYSALREGEEEWFYAN